MALVYLQISGRFRVEHLVQGTDAFVQTVGACMYRWDVCARNPGEVC